MRLWRLNTDVKEGRVIKRQFLFHIYKSAVIVSGHEWCDSISKKRTGVGNTMGE